MPVAAFLLSNGFMRSAASHWAIALSALAADSVDRAGPMAHEQGIRVHPDRPICQIDRLIEPV